MPFGIRFLCFQKGLESKIHQAKEEHSGFELDDLVTELKAEEFYSAHLDKNRHQLLH